MQRFLGFARKQKCATFEAAMVNTASPTIIDVLLAGRFASGISGRFAPESPADFTGIHSFGSVWAAVFNQQVNVIGCNRVIEHRKTKAFLRLNHGRGYLNLESLNS